MENGLLLRHLRVESVVIVATRCSSIPAPEKERNALNVTSFRFSMANVEIVEQLTRIDLVRIKAWKLLFLISIDGEIIKDPREMLRRLDESD